MGQKVNPISLRLQKTNRHFDSCWYDDYNYTHLLLQDLKIKNYLKTVLHQIKYPESRIINSGLPKKNSYNLFYYNPSNSRRKKSLKYQLQNFKEKVSKKKKGFFDKKISIKDVHSFFSFPEQQYWKSGTFTLAQQQIEGLAPYISLADKVLSKQAHFKDLKDFKGGTQPKDIKHPKHPKQPKHPFGMSGMSEMSGVSGMSEIAGTLRMAEMSDQYKNRSKKNEKGYLSFFSQSNFKENLFLFDKKVYPSVTSNIMMPHITDRLKNCYSDNVKKTVYQGNEKAKESVLQTPSATSTSRYVKYPKVYCDKKKSFFNLNQLLLEFVTKNNKNQGLYISSTLSTPDIPNISDKIKYCQDSLGPLIKNTLFANEGDVYTDYKNKNQKQKIVPLLFSLSCFSTNVDSQKDIKNDNKVVTSNTDVTKGQDTFKDSLREFLISQREIKESVRSLVLSSICNEESVRSDVHIKRESGYLLRTKSKPVKNLDSERFFIRYLLAQLYSNYLQNKEYYNAESYTTLYRFLIFFQEKNVKNGFFLKRYRSLQENNEIVPFTNIYHNQKVPFFEKTLLREKVSSPSPDVRKEFLGDLGYSGSHEKGFFQSAKNNLFNITKSDVKTNKNNPLYGRSGVYSSNLVYKSHLEFSLSKQYSSFFNINLFRTLIEKQSASFLVQEIIYYLERKIPFRRIKTQILREIPYYDNIKGIRIKCSGRVGGRSKKAQRSKTQSVKIGQTSLGVFSSKIDFACKSAYTRFGLIGVKVWVCYQ